MVRRIQVASTNVCALLFVALVFLPWSVASPDWFSFQLYMTLCGWTYVALPLTLVTTWIGYLGRTTDRVPAWRQRAFVLGLMLVSLTYLLAAVDSVLVTRGAAPLPVLLPHLNTEVAGIGGVLACAVAALLSFCAQGQARSSMAVAALCSAALFAATLIGPIVE